MKGQIKNEWVNGRAKMIVGDNAEKIIKLRKKKYGFSARLISVFTSQKGSNIVYSIELVWMILETLKYNLKLNQIHLGQIRSIW